MIFSHITWLDCTQVFNWNSWVNNFRLICDGLFYVVSEFSGLDVIDPFNPSEASVRSFRRIVKKEGVADSYANNCLLLLHLLCVLNILKVASEELVTDSPHL